VYVAVCVPLPQDLLQVPHADHAPTQSVGGVKDVDFVVHIAARVCPWLQLGTEDSRALRNSKRQCRVSGMVICRGMPYNKAPCAESAQQLLFNSSQHDLSTAADE
jgi:hypothetical protein